MTESPEDRQARRRAKDAARKRASRERERAGTSSRSNMPTSIREARGGGDGHILGVMTFPAGPEGFARDPEAHWVPNRVLARKHGTAPTEAELDAIERRIAPERTEHCAVRWIAPDGSTLASLSFDVLDDPPAPGVSERVRVADWLLDLGAPIDRDELIEALSDASPGETVVLAFAEPSPEPPLPYVESELPEHALTEDEASVTEASELPA